MKINIFKLQNLSLDRVLTLKLNCVLKTNDDVAKAVEGLKSMGLPPHHTNTKSWDTYKIIDFVRKNGNSNSNILDAGCGYSPTLPYLNLLGFKNLYGCDLSLKSKWPMFVLKLATIAGYKNFNSVVELFENKKNIYNLQEQNLEKTNYESDFFDFVTVLSVIEHGVKLVNFGYSFLWLRSNLKHGSDISSFQDTEKFGRLWMQDGLPSSSI